MFTQFNRSIRLSFNENPKHWACKNILLCMFEYKIVYKFECQRRIEIYTCDYPMNSVLIWSLTRRYINIEGMVNEYNIPQLISCVQFFFCFFFVLNIKLWMNKKRVMIVLQETTTHIGIMWFIQGRCVQIVIIVICGWELGT